jgi:hypothetical protein
VDRRSDEPTQQRSEIPEYSTVRIVALRVGLDPRSGQEYSMPQVGDEGIAIDRNPKSGNYIVEKVAESGATDWLAKFTADELEVVKSSV